jgi:cysteine synthase
MVIRKSWTINLVSSIKGYKSICVTDPNANRATKRGMELYGTRVIVVEDRDPVTGYLGTRLKKAIKYCDRTRMRFGSINVLT